MPGAVVLVPDGGSCSSQKEEAREEEKAEDPATGKEWKVVEGLKRKKNKDTGYRSPGDKDDDDDDDLYATTVAKQAMAAKRAGENKRVTHSPGQYVPQNLPRHPMERLDEQLVKWSREVSKKSALEAAAAMAPPPPPAAAKGRTVMYLGGDGWGNEEGPGGKRSKVVSNFEVFMSKRYSIRVGKAENKKLKHPGLVQTRHPPPKEEEGGGDEGAEEEEVEVEGRIFEFLQPTRNIPELQVKLYQLNGRFCPTCANCCSESECGAEQEWKNGRKGKYADIHDQDQANDLEDSPEFHLQDKRYSIRVGKCKPPTADSTNKVSTDDHDPFQAVGLIQTRYMKGKDPFEFWQPLGNLEPLQISLYQINGQTCPNCVCSTCGGALVPQQQQQQQQHANVDYDNDDKDGKDDGHGKKG